jgi:hypothetical protein
MDADFVVWMPDVEFELNDNYDIHHKHRVCNHSAFTNGEIEPSYLERGLKLTSFTLFFTEYISLSRKNTLR